MTPFEVYQEFMIPLKLQFHMQWVTGVAKVIADSWAGPIIDKAAIVQACLYHDIAKPMTFDLNKQAEYGASPEEIARLAEMQMLLRGRYGDSEHKATVKICEEIGCLPNAVRIVNNLEWQLAPTLMRKNDYESLIAIYADMRVGLKGVLPLEERLADLKARTGEEHGEMPYALEMFLLKQVGLDIRLIRDVDTKMQIISLLPVSEVVS